MARLFSAFVLLACATHLVGAQTSTARPVVEIRTSAQSTVDIPADGASLIINFSATSSTSRAPYRTGAQNAEGIIDSRVTQIRRTLLNLGISGDSITTLGFGSTLTADGYRNDSVFVTSDAVLVRINQLALLPHVIDSALALRAKNISHLRFWARTDDARIAAIADATQRARQQADALARAGGGRLGRLLELSTDPLNRETDALGGLVSEGVMTGIGADPTRVQEPTVTVTVTVFTRWEFIANPR